MVIETKNLSFSYPGKDVLRGITLGIGKGDFVGITGSTGSGKTTLAYCFNGLIPNSIRGRFSGSVSVCGLDTKKSKISQLARKVGFVFQDPDWQLFSLSVKEEISFGLKNLKMGNIDKRIRESLGMVGLDARIYDRDYHILVAGGEFPCLHNSQVIQVALAVEVRIFGDLLNDFG